MFKTPMFAVGATLFVAATGVCLTITSSKFDTCLTTILCFLISEAFLGPGHLLFHCTRKLHEHGHTIKPKRIPVVECKLEYCI